MTSPENGTSDPRQISWDAVKAALPLGSVVHGAVERVVPFGFFVRIDGYPDVRALIDRISFRPGGRGVTDENWPVERDTVEAVVVEHRDDHHQVKLRVGPPIGGAEM